VEGMSRGQREALQQLKSLKRISINGSPFLRLEEWDEKSPREILFVRIAIDCSQETPGPGGEELEDIEEVILGIPRSFPDLHPIALFPHPRFARLPHVQWGHWLCLYLARRDWVPASGMYGYINRLTDWFLRASKGTLYEVGQPLHPPLAYASEAAGCVVVYKDLPPGLVNGLAVIVQRSDNRADVVQWIDERSPQMEPFSHFSGTLGFGLVRVLPKPLAFEFPDTLGELYEALTNQGVQVEDLLAGLAWVARTNKLHKGGPIPLYALIGAPMRGTAGSSQREIHLAAWRMTELEAFASVMLAEDEWSTGIAELQQLLKDVPLSWTRVYEHRPQITSPRDEGRPTEWLRGKNVLLLGCGAIGSRVAEHCARGGVARLTLSDGGVVSPGLLSRQSFTDFDIGEKKVKALGSYLSDIRPGLSIDAVAGEIILDILKDSSALDGIHLVVDATADLSVASALERLRWTDPFHRPAMLTLGVGRDCERGLAALALPASTGAGVDMLNRFSGAAEQDFYTDFFAPSDPDELVQAEMGCERTFAGGDTDVAALTAQLFGWALEKLRDCDIGQVVAPKSLLTVRLHALDKPGQACLEWPNDLLVLDEDYEIRLDQRALARMRAEAMKTAQGHGRTVETGGILIGRFDDACRVLWVVEAHCPPPDSEHAAGRFVLGSAEVKELVAERRHASRGHLYQIGMWHTHPSGFAGPSPIDIQAMKRLLDPRADAPRRALLLILGNGAEPGQWECWLDGSGSPGIYAHIF
jgi:proteasome lid subunit RPN8/RPN11